MSDAARATTEVAKQSPEAAGLMAIIIEHNAAQREMMYPTWETLERRVEEAYHRGYADGWDDGRDKIAERIFGMSEEVFREQR